MNYLILKHNRAFVIGLLTSAINQIVKQGISREKVIDYYIDLLRNMKQEKLFEEVVK